jgi:MFS family permease
MKAAARQRVSHPFWCVIRDLGGAHPAAEEHPSAFAPAGFAAFSVSMTIARLTGDRVVARLGRRTTIIASGVLAACGLSLALLAHTPALAAAGFGVAGLGLANIIPIVFGDAGHETPAAPGLGVASVATLGYAGFLLGPPVIGFLAGITGLRPALSVLVLASITISLLGLRHRPRAAAPV